MENQETKIIVAEGTKELVIRNGEAAQLFAPKQVEIEGVITAAKDYYDIRKGVHQKLSDYVVYSKERGYVKLITDEKDVLGTEISGKLEKNTDLSNLSINGGKTSSLTELHQKLKFMRRFFSDQDKYQALLQNLSRFKASVNQQVEQEFSDRGNKRDLFEVKVDSGLELGFDLIMPLFKGEKAKKFRVEICFATREKNIDVWLESVELKDMQDSEMERIVGDLVLYFQGLGVVTIEQ